MNPALPRALLLVLLSSTAAGASSVRDTISFDFGWKHRTGLTTWAPVDEPPPSNTDPGIHPPEAAPGYKTAGWKDVQLPHDGLIGTAPSKKACPNGCSGKSFIPR